MPVFYTNQISGSEAIFDEEESRHVIRVYRMKEGDRLEFVDGSGNLYQAMISSPDPRGTRIRILNREAGHLVRKFHLHIAIAPTKSTERFEWFLEKATEIGIEEITPILCEHSERSRLRHERLHRVMVSAMKQSGRALLPKLNSITPFEEFISREKADARYIAHCRTGRTEVLTEKPGSASSWLMMIGPEGDFSEDEIGFACRNGFKGIRLGVATYRTETAGIIACQLVEFFHRRQ
jgi:16S rRNA (uracil1498-N3)-methyltransferase